MHACALLRRVRALQRRLGAAWRTQDVTWSRALLQDLALSEGDVPAITSGRYGRDETRRRR